MKEIEVLRSLKSREDVTGGEGKLYNKGCNLYSSSNTIRVIKSRMKWWTNIMYGRDEK
jgi:hypothetical protein